MRHPFSAGALLLVLAFTVMLVLLPVPADTATPHAARSFATPDAAVAALIDAMRHNDAHALRRILGPGSGRLIESGDKVADAGARQKFLAAYDEKHVLAAAGADRIVLTVGPNDWPTPLPLVLSGGRWHFDSRLGAEEIVERRIGRNEIAAIRTALAYVDAQRLYFALTSERGPGEYAQRLVSRPGHHDGLYWPAAEGEPESPLAPLVAQAQEEGYPGANSAGRQMPYQGYYFRILKRQGESAPGGEMDYITGGRMTKGFALVAWPARYGASGIMTFIVNQQGVVFQKDLGERSATLAGAMKQFDPDLSWVRVDVTGP